MVMHWKTELIPPLLCLRVGQDVHQALERHEYGLPVKWIEETGVSDLLEARVEATIWSTSQDLPARHVLDLMQIAVQAVCNVAEQCGRGVLLVDKVQDLIGCLGDIVEVIDGILDTLSEARLERHRLSEYHCALCTLLGLNVQKDYDVSRS
jgi:hypothetical protein